MLKRICVLPLMGVVLSGCSMIYSTTGSFIYDYSENYALPHSLEAKDIDMNCSLSNISVPLLLSFSSIKTPPHKQMIAMYMMTGACAEAQAQEVQLGYFRAFKQQHAAQARDARIHAKRLYARAAQRQYDSYLQLLKAFEVTGDSCPKLAKEDEFYWFAGMVSAMQATMSDMQAQGVVQVPQDLPAKAVRGIQCLDDKTWWGIPQAMQAAVWIIFKGDKPEQVDAWQQLRAASEYGAQQGIRLASTIEVIATDGFGTPQQTKEAIRRYVRYSKHYPSAKKYTMLNVMAQQQILAVSDRMWTQATGARTPINGLGKFWDDQDKPASQLNIDELLK